MRTFATFIAFVSLAAGASLEFLYDDDDSKPVIEHNAEHDFEKSSKPRLVEFYSPICSACRSFKPTFIELAEELQLNYEEVEVYAVSCFPHKELCNKHNIQMYPSLLIFPAHETNGTLVRKAVGESYSTSLISKALSLTPKKKDLAIEESRNLAQDEDNEDEDGKDAEEDGVDEEEDGDDGEEDGDDGKEDEADGEKLRKEKVVKITGDNLKGKPKYSSGNETVTEVGSASVIAEKKGLSESQNENVSEGGNGKDAKVPRESAAKEPKDNKANKGNERDGDSKDAEKEGKKDGDDDHKRDGAQLEDEEKWLRDGASAVAFRAIAARQVRGLNGVEPPKQNGHAPGAVRAKAVAAKSEIDKYTALIEKRKKLLSEKGSNLKRRQPLVARGTNTGPGGEIVLEKPGKSGETEVMRANTPGTSEFEHRKQEILDRIKKDKDRRSRGSLFGSKSNKYDNALLTKRSALPFKKEPKPIGIVRKAFESVPVVKRMFKMSAEEGLILDVTLSFIMGLRHGVFLTDNPLSKERKAALLGWLQLLSIGLPPEWGLHLLIEKLALKIDFISTRDENLQEILNTYPLSRQKWSRECRKHDAGVGFSCGMWRLLHVVTVGVAEHRGGLNLIKSGLMSDDTVTFTPLRAADAIHDYMDNFFRCEECRKHFLSQYEACAFRRCERLTDDSETASADDWKQLALWVWEVHNDVNVRVADKRMTRIQKQLSSQHLQGAQQIKILHSEEDEIRSLWPSLEKCLVCFGDDGRWNEDSVFEYLERTYWDSPNAKFDRLLTHRDVDGEDLSGGGVIWLMIVFAVVIVLLVRVHVHNLAFHTQLRKFHASSVLGVRNKIEDVVAGKQRVS